MTPLMPCRAMKSSPRGLALTIGCQHSTGRRSGRGTRVMSLQLVAAIRHPGWDGVVLAVMRKGALVEGLEDDLDLLFEQLAVFVRVEHGRAERLDLAGVIPASDAEDDPPPGQDSRRWRSPPPAAAGATSARC